MTRFLDLAIVVFLVGLSGVIFVAMRAHPYWADFAPGSAFMPYWVAGIGVFLALLQLWVLVSRDSEVEVEWPEREGANRVILTVCALWLFLAGIPLLGVGVGAALFVLGLLFFVRGQPLLPSLLTTIVTVGIVELVFVYWLNIRLPTGLLGF